MKFFLFLQLLFFLSVHVAFTQERENVQTVLSNDGITNVSLILGPSYKVGVFGQQGSVHLSQQINLILNNNYSFGLLRNSMSGYTEYSIPDQNGNDSVYFLSDKSYSFELKYRFFEEIPFHLCPSLQLGGGFVSQNVEDTANVSLFSDYVLVDRSSYVMVVPGLSFEINMTKRFVIEIGAYYRYVTGLDLENIKETDLCDVNYKIGLYFLLY
jgi:hypothetical protein